MTAATVYFRCPRCRAYMLLPGLCESCKQDQAEQRTDARRDQEMDHEREREREDD
jgi:hypothetical protein